MKSFVGSPAASVTDALQRIYSIQAMVYVGAGRGWTIAREPMYSRLDRLLLVDANPAYAEELEGLVAQHAPGWRSVTALLGASEEDTNYHATSYPAFNGVLSATVWQPYWPNIKALETFPMRQQRLEAVITERGSFADANWLIVDCLPGIPVVEGAADMISTYDVIIMRVVLDREVGDLHESRISVTDRFMSDRGFRRINVDEGNHPAIGVAAYARDWKSAARTIASLVAERDAKAEKLEQLIDERNKASDVLLADIEKLKRLRAQDAQQLGEFRLQLDTSNDVKAKYEAQLNELQQKLAQVSGDRDSVRQELEILRRHQAQLEAIKLERDGLKGKMEEQRNQIERLSEEDGEKEYRQQQIEEEMVKAEAQIELIKDILIREKAF